MSCLPQCPHFMQARPDKLAQVPGHLIHDIPLAATSAHGPDGIRF